MSVVVTNARSRVAYNVARSLGQKGVPVFAADFVPRSMCFRSKYVQGRLVYPSPFSQPEEFLECLLEYVRRVRAEVLIPVFEETFLIAKHKERFSPYVSTAIPDYGQILIAHNKDRWETIARKLDIPVPTSCSPIDLQAGRARTRDLCYPVLIKPKQGGGAWGIQESATPEALEQLLSAETWHGKPWTQFFVQERIRGETHCVAGLFDRGELRAKVAYRQIRDYPSTGGQATLRVSLRSPAAETHFEHLLQELRWHGTCQADFIVDQRSGTAYLIDLNPRLWGSIAQAIASGVDFPYLIYRLAKDGEVAPVRSFETGVVTRWIAGDVAALPSRLRGSAAKGQVLRDFFVPTASAALFDDFSVADPLPFVAWTLDALSRAIKFRSTKPVSHDALAGIWE